MVESTKENRIFPPVSHPLAPPNSYSIAWMPPHWSPLRPWLPAGVPLTFSLWPPEPQRHRLNLLSGRCILGTTVMTTEGTDSEYRCYRYSSKLLPSLYLQHVLPKRAQKRSGSARPPSLFFFCFPSMVMLLGQREDPAVPRRSAVGYREDPVTREQRFHHYWRNVPAVFRYFSEPNDLLCFPFVPQRKSAS